MLNKKRLWFASKAFTIVEISVVVTIIAILATITIVVFSGTRNDAVKSSLQVDADQASTILSDYKLQHGEYPNQVDDCPTPAAGNICLEIENEVDYYNVDNSTSPPSYDLQLIDPSGEFTQLVGESRTALNELLEINDEYSSASYYHSCAIASDNEAYCWGRNTYGQLGDGSTDNSYVPVAVDTSGVLNGKNIAILSSYYYHTCAITYDGQAYCWGYNVFGMLGDGSTSNSSVPVAVDMSGVLNGLEVKRIDAGYYHTCAIASNGQAYCWGYNSFGQFGNNSTSASFVPVAVDTSGALSGLTTKAISAGYYHTCVIASNGQAYCWGNNSYGQLGDNSTNVRHIPVAVDTSGALSGLDIKAISAGYYHTCAIASDDNAYCWGDNAYGQLGDNSTSASLVPVAVDTSGALFGLSVKDISTSYYHTCVIASDNNAYCWGTNSFGGLGNGSTGDSLVPVAVDTSGVLSGLDVRHISAGYYHTCAIASDDNAYCWGWNSIGKLGTGTTTNSLVPIQVVGL